MRSWDQVIDAVGDGEHVIEAMAHQNHDSVFRSPPRDKVEYAVYLAHGEGGRGFIVSGPSGVSERRSVTRWRTRVPSRASPTPSSTRLPFRAGSGLLRSGWLSRPARSAAGVWPPRA